MEHELYPSIDAMLAPESLSALESRAVTDVRCLPFESVDSLSGSRFLIVETNHGPKSRYVVKRLSAEWDWIMRATSDHYGRAVVAWQIGLLDRLPPEIAHAVVACAEDELGWAILMRDVGPDLIPPGDDPIGVRENTYFLAAMAALHATFWEDPGAADLRLGFCNLRHRYAELSPETGRCETGGPDSVPRLILEGWDLLRMMVEPDVAGILSELLEDPRPLCEALDRYPQTVVHGDWKLGNLGLLRGRQPRVILLDWAVIGPAPPGVDLAWYLAVNSARLPVPKEAAIACYRRELERRLGNRFDEQWWQPQLELSLLGGFLQLGWAKALGTARAESGSVRDRERAELAWWSKHVRSGAEWL